MSELKLTPKQNQVIWCLQNNWILVTSCDMKGACVSLNKENQFNINNGVFYNLVDKGLIYQSGAESGFWYLLTSLGKSIKTKQP